jgi:DNA-binding PadR family transcriptional regulator
MNQLSIRPQTAARILKFLALNGPANRYAIRKSKETAAQPTILAAIKNLDKQGLIQGSTERSTRSGKISKHYDLTLIGLVYLVSHIEGFTNKKDRNEFFKCLAVKYRALIPGVFELWSASQEVGKGDEAVQRLFLLCRSLWTMHEDGFQDSEIENIALENAAELFLDPFLIHRQFMQYGEVVGLISEGTESGWMDAVNKNEVLKDAMVSTVLTGVERSVRRANSALHQLSVAEIAVEAKGQVQLLQTEIEEFRLAIRMLQDASGLKVVTAKDEKA